MLGLYLLAAHAVGDFVLQTRWQAARKLDDPSYRLRHVAAYLLPFVPVAAVYGRWGGPGSWTGPLFLLALGVFHYLTDSRRAYSTLGDVVVWWLLSPSRRADELERQEVRSLDLPDGRPEALYQVRSRPSDEAAAGAPTPPNPWPTIPLAVDQTLHLCQLALLGALLLR